MSAVVPNVKEYSENGFNFLHNFLYLIPFILEFIVSMLTQQQSRHPNKPRFSFQDFCVTRRGVWPGRWARVLPKRLSKRREPCCPEHKAPYPPRTAGPTESSNLSLKPTGQISPSAD